MNVIGYAKVSTEDQARDGVCVADQQTKIAAYAVVKDWRVGGVPAGEHGPTDCDEGRAPARKEGGRVAEKMPEKLLTPEEVADRLRISRITVMDYLRAGRIKGRKVGRLWRVPASDLEAFLGEQSPHPSRPLGVAEVDAPYSPLATVEIICAWCVKEGKAEGSLAMAPGEDAPDMHGLCPQHRRRLEVALAARVTEVDALRKEVETLGQQVDP